MKKKLLFCVLALAGSIFVLCMSRLSCRRHSTRQFQQVEHYREVQTVFDACDKQTLVTFDVDHTLIAEADVLAARWGEPPLWFKICAALKHPLVFFNRDGLDRVLGDIELQAKYFVFDPDVVRYIERLRRQECPVLALTWIASGAFGAIKNAPEWRARMLYDFGINLEGQFQDAVFTTLAKSGGEYPCLHKGILCTNGQPKGKVLGAFLDYYHLKPARIISFDDSAVCLDSIADECARRGIAFTGYQVAGATKLLGKWNNRRALLQFDHIVKYARWLTDKEADKILAGAAA